MHWCLKPLEKNTPHKMSELNREQDIIDDMLDCRGLTKRSPKDGEPFALEADCFDLDHDPERGSDDGREGNRSKVTGADKYFSIADLFHLRISRDY